jgi:hypothetical protein
MRFSLVLLLIISSCRETTKSTTEWPNVKIKPFESRSIEKQEGSYIIQSNQIMPSINLKWEKIESNEAVSLAVYSIENGNIVDTLKLLDDINKTETIIENGITYNQLINLAIRVKNSDGEESPLNKSNVVIVNITKPVLNDINESLILEIANTNNESVINYESLRNNLVDSISVNFEFRNAASTNILDFKKIISFIGSLRDNNIADDIAVNGSYGVDNRRIRVNIDSLLSKHIQNKISILSDYDQSFFVDNDYSLLKTRKGSYRVFMYLYKSSALYRSDYLKEYVIQ